MDFTFPPVPLSASGEGEQKGVRLKRIASLPFDGLRTVARNDREGIKG